MAGAGAVSGPIHDELCRALAELLADRVAERDVLRDEWTDAAGRFRDDDDRAAIAALDAELARYRDLLRRASAARARAAGRRR